MPRMPLSWLFGSSQHSDRKSLRRIRMIHRDLGIRRLVLMVAISHPGHDTAINYIDMIESSRP